MATHVCIFRAVPDAWLPCIKSCILVDVGCCVPANKRLEALMILSVGS